MSRSKRLGEVASAAPPGWVEPPCGGRSSPQVYLVPSMVFQLPFADILANYRIIAAHCRHKVPSCPEVLTHEISLPLSAHPRQMDGALALRGVLAGLGKTHRPPAPVWFKKSCLRLRICRAAPHDPNRRAISRKRSFTSSPVNFDTHQCTLGHCEHPV